MAMTTYEGTSRIRIDRDLRAQNRPLLMGILNVTPDSFSDGGTYLDPDRALRRARIMVKEGADILDIGAESTRPGAHTITVQQELDRLMPIVTRLLAEDLPVLLSVDTSKPAVMRAVLRAGVQMINDVNALQAEGALEAVADADAGVCLMHKRGTPSTMQQQTDYTDVVRTVKDFLEARIHACLIVGIAPSRIVIDPGFGFAKKLEHNIVLLQQLRIFCQLGYPVLVGLSNKSMVGQILGKGVSEREQGSLVAHTVALLNGANILRTHHVAASRDVILMLERLIPRVTKENK